jgi:hypothetical protein
MALSSAQPAASSVCPLTCMTTGEVKRTGSINMHQDMYVYIHVCGTYIKQKRVGVFVCVCVCVCVRVCVCVCPVCDK